MDPTIELPPLPVNNIFPLPDPLSMAISRPEKVLLCILAHSGATAGLARHWPFWERSGHTILAVGRADTVTTWPVEVKQVRFGRESYLDNATQIRRFLDLLEYVLHRELAYDAFIFLEWDCLLLRPLGPIPALGLLATPAGTRAPDDADGFVGTRFFHCPWAMSAVTAELIRDYGQRLLKLGLTERGFLDRWLGLLCDLYDLPFHPLHAYTQNALDRPEYLAEARAAIAAGAVALHGVKTAQQFEALNLSPPAA